MKTFVLVVALLNHATPMKGGYLPLFSFETPERCYAARDAMGATSSITFGKNTFRLVPVCLEVVAPKDIPSERIS